MYALSNEFNFYKRRTIFLVKMYVKISSILFGGGLNPPVNRTAIM
jgi:hypothetical protein